MDRAASELRFVHGSPDTVAAKIHGLQNRVGANVFMGEFSFGELTWDQVRRSHELFMGDVAPRLAFKPSPMSVAGRPVTGSED